MRSLETFPIIDVHTHIFPEKIAERAAENISTYYTLPREGNGTLDMLKKLSGGLDVRAYLISSAATNVKNVEIGNDFMASQLADKSLIPFGSVHAAFEKREEEVERIAELGLFGIKLHCDFQGFPIDDSRMDVVYKKAAALSLPVLFHLGDPNTDLTTPARLRAVIDRHPDLTVIAAHMGGYLQKKEADRLLVGLPIYFDSSEWQHSMSASELVDMCRAHGIDRILFGCDYPLSSTMTEATAVYNAGFTEKELEKLFYDNAAKLFGATA